MAERAKSVFCFSNLFFGGLLDILDVDLPCGFFPFFNSNFFYKGLYSYYNNESLAIYYFRAAMYRVLCAVFTLHDLWRLIVTVYTCMEILETSAIGNPDDCIAAW